MPQFDPAVWPTQLFWLTVSFVVLYLLMARVALPRISSILEEREFRIGDSLRRAESLKQDAEAAVAAYEKLMADARAKAQEQVHSVRERAAQDAAERHAELNDRLSAEVAAAETRIAGAHAHEPFYLTGEFWVAVGFVLFVLLVGRTAYRVVTAALDDRAQRIKDQVEEATRLAEEAQQLLATYERKQRDAAAEAETVVEMARREADRLSDQAEKDLERSLTRREALAFERIAQAEAAAVAEVRAKATEIALEATRRLLVERMSGDGAGILIDEAIKELPKRLN